jgi:hypothetical protein
MLLQQVGAQFVAQPNTAALVAAQVDQYAGVGVGDGAQCRPELGPAVAAQGSGQVAGEAYEGQERHRSLRFSAPRILARQSVVCTTSACTRDREGMRSQVAAA